MLLVHHLVLSKGCYKVSSLTLAFSKPGQQQQVWVHQWTEFTEFLTNNGIISILMVPYHPCLNILAEQAVLTIKWELKDNWRIYCREAISILFQLPNHIIWNSKNFFKYDNIWLFSLNTVTPDSKSCPKKFWEDWNKFPEGIPVWVRSIS